MSKIKCIIIEDEPLAIKVLSDYVSQVPFLELQATFKDAILATDWLRSNSTELIFLDIHLPKLKGMAYLKMKLIPAGLVGLLRAPFAPRGPRKSRSRTEYVLRQSARRALPLWCSTPGALRCRSGSIPVRRLGCLRRRESLAAGFEKLQTAGPIGDARL